MSYNFWDAHRISNSSAGTWHNKSFDYASISATYCLKRLTNKI